MKHLIYYLVIGLFIVGCTTTKTTTQKDDNLPEGAVKIANEDLEYEIIIIDPGFETYLNTIAKPANFYSQEYYENKNHFYVLEWNQRVLKPSAFNSSIYENHIDYERDIDYGLDVNYKLYNYFKFVEHKYGQKFLLTRG
jgi:hypothetical protein